MELDLVVLVDGLCHHRVRRRRSHRRRDQEPVRRRCSWYLLVCSILGYLGIREFLPRRGRAVLRIIALTIPPSQPLLLLLLFCSPDFEVLYELAAPQPLVLLFEMALGDGGQIVLSASRRRRQSATLGIELTHVPCSYTKHSSDLDCWPSHCRSQSPGHLMASETAADNPPP